MQTPSPQFPAEPLHAATQVLVHRPLGNAEMPRGFAVRQSIEFAEDHDFVRSRRQSRQDIREQALLFENAEGFRDVRSLIYDVLNRQTTYFGRHAAAIAAVAIQRDVSGHAEKKGFDRSDRSDRSRLPDTDVRLLDNILDIALVREASAQVSPELPVMRVHLIVEPAGLFGMGRLP